ncbi:hypothetical protein OU426_11825 [Frigidibacter sp. RF13]|nr:hypothetical protein [Frigidibacter sp. RF13]
MFGDIAGVVATGPTRNARLVAARARAVVIVVVIAATAAMIVILIMVGAVIGTVLRHLEHFRKRRVERMPRTIVGPTPASAAVVARRVVGAPARKKFGGQEGRRFEQSVIRPVVRAMPTAATIIARRIVGATATTGEKIARQDPIGHLADSLELSIRHHQRFTPIRESGGGGPGQRNGATCNQNCPFHCAVSLGFARRDRRKTRKASGRIKGNLPEV